MYLKEKQLAYFLAFGFDSAQPPRKKRHHTTYKYKAQDLPTAQKKMHL